MQTDTYIPEAVNPHQGKEWEMMCAGKKPVALFALHHEEIPEEFSRPHDFFTLTVKFISAKKRRRGSKELIFHIFSLKNHQAQAERLAELLSVCYGPNGSITPEIEQEIGILLGYERADIAVYLNWVAQFKHSLQLPPQMLAQLPKQKPR